MPPPPPASPTRARAAHALAGLLSLGGYLALSLVWLRPIWRVMGSAIAPDSGDPLFNLVVLKWGIHQLRLGLPHFWNMPFFFPAQRVTTFSDHLLGPAALGTVFTAVVPNPIAFYNLLFLASFVLSGWTTWYVLRRYGTGAAAAFLGGCMFAFSPFRWDQMSHVQVLLMQWIPLTLWLWHRLLAAPSGKRAALFLAVYVLHVTGGSYLGYMIHFPLLALLLCHARELFTRERWRASLSVLASTGAAMALLLVAVYLPYVEASRDRARSPTEIQVFGASLASYVTPSGSNLYAGPWSEPWHRPENTLFAGFLPTLLAGLAAARGWRRYRTVPRFPIAPPRRAALLTLWGLALIGWAIGELRVWSLAGPLRPPDLPLLSNHRLGIGVLAAAALALLLRRRWGGNWPFDLSGLDPWERGLLFSGLLCFLLTFPVLYLPLMRIIPGLSGMRVPARFYAFVSFSLVWFAARELDARLRSWQPASAGRRWGAAAGVAALLLLELTPRPVFWSPLPQAKAFAAVYHWLARQKGVAGVLELPIQDNSTDILYMYYATLHWKPLVNGYSGYIPDHYVRLQHDCCFPLPAGDVLDRLRDWGVTHVLIHKADLELWERRRVAHWWEEDGIDVEYVDDDDWVYRIAP